MTVRYDTLGALDGSDQRLFILTPADEATEKALRTLVSARTYQLGGTTRLRAVAS